MSSAPWMSEPAPPGSVLPPALYACDPWHSRGRLIDEPPSRTRSPFQRDRDRIIHCAAFRRLKYKTQVFVVHEGDNFRTRLTHSLEVSQIARSLCRVLALNEDLAETLALAHDLGHTPFGHAGEEALDTAMRSHGGFDHNDQSLRIITRLERRYPAFDGLNLTWETLEGLVKHNGPLAGPRAGARQDRPLPVTIGDYNARHDLALDSFPSLEAQLAALSDDIAYNNHDIEDGLRAGLFDIEDLDEVPLVGPVFRAVEARHPGLDRSRKAYEAIRDLIGLMVDDLLDETRRRLADLAPRSPDDIRRHREPVAAFSEDMEANDKGLKRFLFQRMYRHYKVNRMMAKARRIVTDLYALFVAQPDLLPDDWQAKAGGPDSPQTARVVADYVAGMTDRYATQEHRRLFDLHA